MRKSEKGFTLIELLIVIGIIAILASGVIVAINPGQQFAQARDASRESHINTLHTTLLSYQVNNQGNLSGLSLPTEPTEICNTNDVSSGDCGTLVDLSTLTTEGYINSLPVDPQGGVDASGTGYFVAEGSIILVADKAETRFIGIGITEADYGGSGDTGFACGDNLDYEGQTYGTVEIGNQCWMAENLNVGTEISVSDYTSDDGIIEKFCYQDTTANCDTYGGLYEWEEAMKYTAIIGAQGICPDEWHIPSDQEFTDLENWLSSNGYSGVEGDALKDPAAGWCLSGTCGGTGFLALPGGYLGDMATFVNQGSKGFWWLSDDSTNSYAVMRNLNDTDSVITQDTSDTYKGYSVRCIKN